MLEQTSQLYIIEIFRSVQGETSYTGLPTSFVRLAACNLRCTWCDTTYSFGRGTPWLLEDILKRIREFGCRYVCITGGEPLLQNNAHHLMRRLCDEGFILSLETSGSLSTQEVDPRVKVILDIKCPGSGMEQKNHWQNIAYLRSNDEIKFVIKNRADYDYCKAIMTKHSLSDRVETILLSPVFGQLEPRQLVDWMLEDRLPVRLNLQVHKFIWTPETRGV